jgi:uncharacterized protein YkwD
MHPKHPASRACLRAGWTWSIAALAALLALSVALGSARPAGAVVGDCVSDASWGTLNDSYAQQVLALVNQHRTGLGRTALVISPTLTNAANWKSLHMAYYRYMDHNDPAPPVARTTSQRLAACGYPIGSVGWGENIAYGYASPQSVMTAWLNSSGHRTNIENASFRAIGIGVARASNGTYYWTQAFGTLADGGAPPPQPPPVTVPTVSLGSTPAASTTSTTASFSWTTTGSPTSTTCSLDGAVATPCSSPVSYAGLGLSGHTFVVRVSNSAGSNAATYNWTVTAAPPPPVVKPTVTFTQKPRNRQTARFAWVTSGSPTSVTCTLDGAAVTPCSSPLTLTGLRRGVHTFVVTASNAGGSASATHSWYAQ